jgi:hypothetical protein
VFPFAVEDEDVFAFLDHSQEVCLLLVVVFRRGKVGTTEPTAFERLVQARTSTLA